MMCFNFFFKVVLSKHFELSPPQKAHVSKLSINVIDASIVILNTKL